MALDIEKAGTYPIVLSPALQQKGTDRVYTGIRYNHKPTLRQSTSLLRPTRGKDNYQLSITTSPPSTSSTAESATYRYAGKRTAKDDQYVLIFDPVEQHFMLHQIDSSFDMNVVEMPDDDPAEYEQVGGTAGAVKAGARRGRGVRKVERKGAAGSAGSAAGSGAGAGADSDEVDLELEEEMMRDADADGEADEEMDAEADADAEFEDDDEEEEEEERNADVDPLKLPSPVGTGMDVDEVDLDDLEAEMAEGFRESSESEEE